MIKLAFVVLALVANQAWCSPSKILGTWSTQKPEKNAKIEIAPCAADNQKFCGKIVWLEEPTYPDGSPKIDKNNIDTYVRSRPLMGLEILSGFTEADETSWVDGTIYNPEDGKTYSCTITLNEEDGQDVLDVRGYIGISLFGKTQRWIRSQ